MRAPRIRSSKTITHSWQSSGGKQRANRCPFSVVTINISCIWRKFINFMMFIIILKGADILISCALENKLLLINNSYHAIYSNLWSYLYFHFKVVQHLWCTNVSIREPPRNGPSKSSTKGYALESLWKLQKIYLFSN